MKQIGFAVLLLSLSGAVRADDIDLDCTHPTATIELDLCADREAEAVDRELNLTYRRISAGLDAQARALLLAAQRAWIAYRDKQCNYETARAEGSGHNVAHLNCLMRVTKARTRELKQHASQ